MLDSSQHHKTDASISDVLQVQNAPNASLEPVQTTIEVKELDQQLTLKHEAANQGEANGSRELYLRAQATRQEHQRAE